MTQNLPHLVGDKAERTDRQLCQPIDVPGDQCVFNLPRLLGQTTVLFGHFPLPPPPSDRLFGGHCLVVGVGAAVGAGNRRDRVSVQPPSGHFCFAVFHFNITAGI